MSRVKKAFEYIVEKRRTAAKQEFLLFFPFFYTNLKTNIVINSLSTVDEKAFVDIVDYDQTARNVLSDLWSTLSTFFFFILDYN